MFVARTRVRVAARRAVFTDDVTTLKKVIGKMLFVKVESVRN